MSEEKSDKTESQDSLIEDPLTKVASRRYLVTKGTQDISLARRHKEALALLQIEIDNFKSVYTEYGDEISDKLLQEVATTLRSLCRTEDVVSRIRGAVFAILAPRTNANQSLLMCARLRTAVMDRAFVHNDIRIALSFSIGIAIFNHDSAADMEHLLAVAAQHAAEAQRAGGNCAVAESGTVVAMPPGASPSPPTTASQRMAATKPGETKKPVATGMSLDKAIELLASGRPAEIQPYLANLVGRFIPLLEYGNKELNLSLGFAIEAMKKRIQEVAIEKEFGED